MHTSNKIYSLLLLLCVAGYGWIFISSSGSASAAVGGSCCLFRKITSFPCPSCGTTRSIMALTHGQWEDAWMFNPLGYIAALVLLVVPFWILYDLLNHKLTLFTAWNQMERIVSTPRGAFFFFFIIIINWIWNIVKAF